MSNLLYKYTSLKQFEYIVDTIVHSRLYAAPFKKLNDPMEGFYLQNDKSSIALNAIIEDEKYRVCSLSMNHDNPLMWSHYADSYAGVVLGVEVIEHEIKDVNYSKVKLVYEPDEVLSQENHLKELTQKFEYWNYEEEKRVVLYDEEYVKVKIKKIFLGNRISQRHKELIQSLVKTYDSDIEICECQVINRFICTI